MLRIQALSTNFTIQVQEEAAPLPDGVERRVEDLWRAETAHRGGQLFNGQILSLSDIQGQTLIAKAVEYRLFLAQLREPALFDVLGVRPLAVTGLVRIGTRIVLGRRASHVTQDPGHWELVPSGGLTPRSPGKSLVEEQLREELEEELGIVPAAVKKIEPFLLVDDSKSHVVDLCAEITLSSEPDVRVSTEHSELRLVETSRLTEFYSSTDGILEATRAILSARGL